MMQPITFDVPIAIFVFNRPDLTELVFEVVSKIRPSKLFLIADGPRKYIDNEAEKVEQVLRIFDGINWPCDVYTNISETNMGCKIRVSSGISWVFKHVDRAIILEDDCIPSLSFFTFCDQMLTLYKNNKEVFSISGSNFNSQDVDNEFGHTFSRYSLMWGWATWADRWDKYVLYPTDSAEVILRTWGPWRPIIYSYWVEIFKNIENGNIDTWDYQWILTVWRERGLSCRPSRNLVENLGFRADATHTTNESSDLRLPADQTVCAFSLPLTPVEPNILIERDDEKKWGRICLRSVLLMRFPALGKMMVFLRNIIG